MSGRLNIDATQRQIIKQAIAELQSALVSSEQAEQCGGVLQRNMRGEVDRHCELAMRLVGEARR